MFWYIAFLLVWGGWACVVKWVYARHSIHAEVRSQISGFVLSFHRGFWGPNSGCQAFTAGVFTQSALLLSFTYSLSNLHVCVHMCTSANGSCINESQRTSSVFYFPASLPSFLLSETESFTSLDSSVVQAGPPANPRGPLALSARY